MCFKLLISVFILFLISFIPNYACEQEEQPHFAAQPLSFVEEDSFFDDPNTLAQLDQIELEALRATTSSIKCLTTHEEHIAHLEEAFEKAEKSILITNFGETYKSLTNTRLGDIIPKTYHRNMVKIYGPDYKDKPNLRPTVRLYLRYNYKDFNAKKSIPLNDSVLDFLDKYFILNIQMIPTHAKILMVDDRFLTIGSFNWLTDYTSSYRSYNRSVVYKAGDLSRPDEGTFHGLKQHIWQILKYYLNKEYAEKYGNKHNYRAAYQAKRFSYMNYSQEHELKNKSTLTYIPTLEKHRIELLQILKTVKNRLIIVSPFVAFDGAGTYQRDFVKPLLKDVLERGVSIYFICLPNNENKRQYFYSNMRSYLKQFLGEYQNLMLLTYNNIHAKTIIKDDDLIAEGSFNWLCAARDETNPDHKHEATLLIEGVEAKPLIEDFYMKSEIGNLLKSKISQESKKRKRPNIDTAATESVIKRPKTDIYAIQEEKIDQDSWVNHPFWNPPHTVKYSPERSSLRFGAFFEILSGKSFNKDGYCVSINREYYLADANDEIAYFGTIQLAKEAAYEEWQQYYSYK